jgi:DNA replication protein DnaC
MLTHPTLDQLRALKLDGMVQAFIELEAQEETRNLAHAEWLALLLDREAADRGTRRFQARLRAARLRHSQAAIEDVDYRTPRRLDKALFQQLATCRWIAEHRGLLVTGPCGIGKSWLSCALAQKACRDGCRQLATAHQPERSPIRSASRALLQSRGSGGPLEGRRDCRAAKQGSLGYVLSNRRA